MAPTTRIGPKVPTRAFLREHRKAAGLTQQALADLLGTSKSAVCRWESGKRGVNVGILAALAEVYGKPTDALFTLPPPRIASKPQKPPTAALSPDMQALAVEVARIIEQRRRSRA